MRIIDSGIIAEAVENLIGRAQYDTPADLDMSLRNALEKERSPLGKQVISQILENRGIAAGERLAICQDTGICVVFMDVGQDVHISGTYVEDAIQEAVRRAYAGLRKSVVRDPLFDRTNTRDNTPAVIHSRIVPGAGIKLLVICKGFGSENMSRIKLLPPSAGVKGVKDFIVETARLAGANACPPMILGVCVGGTFEQAAMEAKRMTAVGLDYENPDERYRDLEEACLAEINRLGIGPAGFGGSTTALSIRICARPTHIASLPVAVNVCCHASRHAETEI
ncbi:MAG: fumarate hydratase [Clostridia bacterium]|nr:fumarate hydratase [Clostridia bacterium]